jgi:DNA uptake protein ComE-like DNA-binding protein
MRDRIGVHSGQHAPRKIRHDKRSIDLNTASRKELANLPMVGRDRALSIIPNRPFRGWDNVVRISGFGKGMIFYLKSGGAQVGAAES